MSTLKTYNVDSGDTTNLVLKTNGTTALTINGTTQAVTIAGAQTTSGNQTITGNLTVNGNATLGDASGDTVTVQAGTAALPTIIPSGNTNTGIWFPAADTIAISTAGTEAFRIDASGEVGIGVTPAGTGLLELKAGTATVSPFKFNAGTNLTTPVAGVVEYDGTVFYTTNDSTSDRGLLPSSQIFRLTANGSAIGPAINNFFGANSAVELAAAGIYELEAHLRFTKTTAGTVTVTLTTSAAPVNLSGTVQYGNAVGGTATGASNQISLYNSTATGAAFGASASLTTAVSHTFIVYALIEANAAASNLRINVTSSAGTVTPLRTSYYKLTKLPAGNVGSFVA